jgi:hypothetical protein
MIATYQPAEPMARMALQSLHGLGSSDPSGYTVWEGSVSNGKVFEQFPHPRTGGGPADSTEVRAEATKGGDCLWQLAP